MVAWCRAKGKDMVVVKAQVMTRDDSKGGWVPVEGGGMSVVGLQKLLPSGKDNGCHEYVICGHRMTDNAVSVTC